MHDPVRAILHEARRDLFIVLGLCFGTIALIVLTVAAAWVLRA